MGLELEVLYQTESISQAAGAKAPQSQGLTATECYCFTALESEVQDPSVSRTMFSEAYREHSFLTSSSFGSCRLWLTTLICGHNSSILASLSNGVLLLSLHMAVFL